MEPKIVNGIVVNDSPKMPNGKSAMFVRILDKADTKKMVDMIRDNFPDAPATLKNDMLSVYAPDGDLVFSTLPTDERKAYFICRCHREVFSDA